MGEARVRAGGGEHCTAAQPELPFSQAAPPPPRRADHSREKQEIRMAYREHGKVPAPLGVSLRGPSCPFVDNSFLLFQSSRAPAPHDGRIIRE